MRLAGGLRQRPIESARRVRDHRHRLSDRSRAHDGLLGFDGADRQHLRQHRDGRLPARERARHRGPARRARARRPGSAALVHERSSATCGSADGFVQAQQHHAAEAQPGGARARARDCAARPSARRARSCSPSTTRRSATSSTPKTTCSRWSRGVPTRARAVSLVRGRDGRGDVRRREAGRTRRAALDHRSPSSPIRWRAITACRSRPRTRIAARFVTGSQAAPGRPISELVREISSDVTGKAVDYTEAQLAQILSPRHFVEVRTTYGGPALRDGARDQGLPAAAGVGRGVARRGEREVTGLPTSV